MKSAIIVIFLVSGILLALFLSFELQRWINYNLYYKGKIQELNKPLSEKISELENRVSLLESNAVLKSH